MDKDTILAIAGVIGGVLFLTQVILAQRNVQAFTKALVDLKSDAKWVDQAHQLAVDVVPVETLHKALDTINSFAEAVKTLTPPQIDNAIDAGTGLLNTVVGDNVPVGTTKESISAVG